MNTFLRSCTLHQFTGCRPLTIDIEHLRRIRKHDYVIWISNGDTGEKGSRDIVEFLTTEQQFKKDAIEKLPNDIIGGKKVVLYERDEEKNIRYVLIDDSVAFLQLVVFLCYLQVFVLGFSKYFGYTGSFVRQMLNNNGSIDCWVYMPQNPYHRAAKDVCRACFQSRNSLAKHTFSLLRECSSLGLHSNIAIYKQ